MCASPAGLAKIKTMWAARQAGQEHFSRSFQCTEHVWPRRRPCGACLLVCLGLGLSWTCLLVCLGHGQMTWSRPDVLGSSSLSRSLLHTWRWSCQAQPITRAQLSPNILCLRCDERCKKLVVGEESEEMSRWGVVTLPGSLSSSWEAEWQLCLCLGAWQRSIEMNIVGYWKLIFLWFNDSASNITTEAVVLPPSCWSEMQ